MKNLILITNSKNDINSQKYIKSINTIRNNFYHDRVNIKQFTCETQDELLAICEKEDTQSNFLLIEPTNLIMPHFHKYKDAEKNQVVDVIYNMIEDNLLINPLDSKILIIGKSRVGKALFQRLCLVDGFFVSVMGRMPTICPEDTKHYDVIINASASSSELQDMYIDRTATVYDIAGNFKSVPIPVWSEENQCLAYVPEQYKLITARTIGKQTTKLLLEGVVNG